MTTHVIYSNEYYEVHLVDSDEETPYHLYNKEHGVVEAREANKPQILVYAEQFNHMLKNDFHIKVTGQMEAESEPFDFASMPMGDPH